MSSDLLGSADVSVFDTLRAFFTSPVEHYGLVLAAVSISAGLVVRWVRRAVG